MKRINLEALDLKNILLANNQFFSDDGYKPDLNQHLEELYKKYGADNNVFVDSDTFGCCSKFQKEGKCYVHIFYKKINDQRMDLFNRAHEESHALIKLGRIGYFFLDCLWYGNMPPIIEWMKRDEEAVANVAGAHAVVKRGLL